MEVEVAEPATTSTVHNSDQAEDDLSSEGVSEELMPKVPALRPWPPLSDELSEEEEAAAERALNEVGGSSARYSGREVDDTVGSEDTGATPSELQRPDAGEPSLAPVDEEEVRRGSIGSQPSLEEVTDPDPSDLLEPELEAVVPPTTRPPPFIEPIAAPPPLTPPPPLPVMPLRQDDLSQLDETPRPVEAERPAEAPRPAEASQLTEAPRPAEASQPTEVLHPQAQAEAVAKAKAVAQAEAVALAAEFGAGKELAASSGRMWPVHVGRNDLDEREQTSGPAPAAAEGPTGQDKEQQPPPPLPPPADAPPSQDEVPSDQDEVRSQGSEVTLERAPIEAEAIDKEYDDREPLLGRGAPSGGQAAAQRQEPALEPPLGATLKPSDVQQPQASGTLLSPGQRAKIVGLHDPHYNNRECIIDRYEVAEGVYIVRIADEGETFMKLLAANVVLVEGGDDGADKLRELLQSDSKQAGSGGGQQPGAPDVAVDCQEEESSDDDITEAGASRSFPGEEAMLTRLLKGPRRCLSAIFVKYTMSIARYPCIWILVYGGVLGFIIGFWWRHLDLEEVQDLSSFVRADGDAMRNRDAFTLALDEQNSDTNRRLRELHAQDARGTDSSERRLQGSPEWLDRELIIVYEAKQGNVFDERVLRDVQDFELRLRSLPQWQDMCQNDVTLPEDRWGCDPGESFIAFSWPEFQPSNVSLHQHIVQWTGRGQDRMPLSATLTYLNSAATEKETRDMKRFFPSDFVPFGSQVPSRLRTMFTFVLTYSYTTWSSADSRAGRESMKQKYEDFITGPVYDTILDLVDSYDHIRIYYSGDVILDHETMTALTRDLFWAIGSLAYVTLYIFIHNRSWLLTLGSFFIIFTSVPLAYVLVPAARTTFATLMSVFLITVIDIDIIFVFNDFWEQSAVLRNLDARLRWMLLRAGKSCLATSLTTSVSFFANLASALQPLREFGLFMGLCVMNVYVLALLFLPPLIALEDRRLGKRGRKRKNKGQVSGWRVAADPDMLVSTISTVTSGALTTEEQPLVASGDQSARSDPACVARREEPRRKSRMFACCRKGPKKEPYETRTYMILSSLVEAISRCLCKYIIVLLTIAMVGVFIAGALAGFDELDTSLPDIFPEDHNQVAGKDALDKFLEVTTFTELPFRDYRFSGAMCDPRGVLPGPGGGDLTTPAPTPASPPCVLNWCTVRKEAAPAIEATETELTTQGTCWRSPTRLLQEPVNTIIEEADFSLDICKAVLVNTRMVFSNSIPIPADQDVASGWRSMLSQTLGTTIVLPSSPVLEVAGEDPVVQEDWTTGHVNTSYLMKSSRTSEARWGTGRRTDPGLYLCNVDFMCFMGTRACELPGWQQTTNAFMTMELQVAEGNGRRLDEKAGSEAERDAANTLPEQTSQSSLSESLRRGRRWPNPHQRQKRKVKGTGLNTSPVAVTSVATTSLISQSQSHRAVSSALLLPGEQQAQPKRPTLCSSWFLQPVLRHLIRPRRRRMQAVPPDSQIDIDVVYGIRPIQYTPKIGAPDELWSYDPNFEPDNPWAQRAMYTMCMEARPVGEPWDPWELWVTDYECWIRNLRDYLARQNPPRLFPSRDFTRDLMEWLSLNTEFDDHLWFEDGVLKAAKMKFWVDVDTEEDSDSALDYMKYWDRFIDHMNAIASVTANDAFHTSAKWVSAEAQAEIVNSTLATVIIECILSWIGICVFTGNLVLASLVLLLILGNICGLLFFMITIMDWTIGPIEVIFIVVFLGFSVTYGLHASHNYSVAKPDDKRIVLNEKIAWKRRHRKRAGNKKECRDEVAQALKTPAGIVKAKTRSCILEVGGAIMSSTVSTVGSSVFLLFCKLQIFVSLGFVVIAVTTLSIVFTLISLPAVLMVVGPGVNPWWKRCLRWVGRCCCRRRGNRDKEQAKPFIGDDEEAGERGGFGKDG